MVASHSFKSSINLKHDKENIYRHIIEKLLEIRQIENKEQLGGGHISFKGAIIKLTADFSLKIMEDKRQ